MTLKNKIIGTLTALSITGASIVGVNGACVDDKGLTMFPAEELIIYKDKENKIEETDKICFKAKNDYEVYKEYYIDTYSGMTGKDRALWFLTDEGKILDDVLTHEIKKRGTVSFPYDEDTDDIFLKIINELNS